jgi:hypothetical protein
MKSRKTLIWVLVLAAVAASVIFVWFREHHWSPRTITIQGAVVQRNSDPRKRMPIPNVLVTATDGRRSATARSDNSGFFKIVVGAGVWPQSIVTLDFQNPDYRPFKLSFQLGLPRQPIRLFVAELTPRREEADLQTAPPANVVANIRVRYTMNERSDTNVGSAVKTFQVENQGDIPCDHQSPCSPNGHWKASVDSVTLDAGPGNIFRNARCSCIAGPCPFTHINSSGFEDGGRVITASATDWSDTATFLLEAEVYRDAIDSSVRESYPVRFDRTLNFTLPPTQEGVSIEADVNGTPMVFPLGPDLYLSWANCTARVNADKSTVYQCELKPDYRF